METYEDIARLMRAVCQHTAARHADGTSVHTFTATATDIPMHATVPAITLAQARAIHDAIMSVGDTDDACTTKLDELTMRKDG